jgi:predicted SnoaL-like aldol condensation-catalyzing enzyme
MTNTTNLERRRKDDQEHEKLNAKLDSVLAKLDEIQARVIEAEKRELSRAHLDAKIIQHDEAMNNGKQGLLSIRNEWISNKTQLRAITVALIIQALVFVFVEFVSGK